MHLFFLFDHANIKATKVHTLDQVDHSESLYQLCLQTSVVLFNFETQIQSILKMNLKMYFSKIGLKIQNAFRRKNFTNFTKPLLAPISKLKRATVF